MARRAMVILWALVLMPAGLQARLQDRSVTGGQEQVSLRLFVEGSQSATTYFIEKLRSMSREFGMNFSFVASVSEPYDARLVITEGTGSEWARSASSSSDRVFYGYCSTVALAPDSKLLFAVSRSGGSLGIARAAVVREMIKSLHLAQIAFKQKPSVSGVGSQGQSADQLIEGLSGEPGVYFKSPTGWNRLDPVSPVNVKAKDIGLAMLSFGAVPIRAVGVYEGGGASLQIGEGRPSFYVRGFAVSDTKALIVRVERKEKSREIRVATVAPSYAQAGFNDKNTRKVKITRFARDVIVITPIRELEPGQYVLLLDASETDNGYDFGIN